MKKKTQIKIVERISKNGEFLGYRLEMRSWGKVIRKPYEKNDLVLDEWGDWVAVQKYWTTYCQTLEEADALKDVMLKFRPEAEFIPDEGADSDKTLAWRQHIYSEKERRDKSNPAIWFARGRTIRDCYKITQPSGGRSFFLCLNEGGHKFPTKIKNSDGEYEFPSLEAAQDAALAHHKG